MNISVFLIAELIVKCLKPLSALLVGLLDVPDRPGLFLVEEIQRSNKFRQVNWQTKLGQCVCIKKTEEENIRSCMGLN